MDLGSLMLNVIKCAAIYLHALRKMIDSTFREYEYISPVLSGFMLQTSIEPEAHFISFDAITPKVPFWDSFVHLQ